MSLHTSSIHFEGRWSAEMVPLLERLNYKLVGTPVPAHTAEQAAELLDAETGNRNIVRKAVYEFGNWTFLHDPEMVVMTENEVLSEFARSHGIRIFSWVCEGLSRTYGFRMFAPDLVRSVMAVGDELVEDVGAAIPQESGMNWADCADREVMALADRLGAPYDGFALDRTYQILTLDESQMSVPDLSGVSIKMPFRPEDLVVRAVKNPWWKFW